MDGLGPMARHALVPGQAPSRAAVGGAGGFRSTPWSESLRPGIPSA